MTPSTMIRALLGATLLATAGGCNGFTGASDYDTSAVDEGETPRDGLPAPQALSCSYPEGSYGLTEGETVPRLSWAAIPPGNDVMGNLTTTELIDCDGHKGFNALIFLTHKPG
ncbi:MAG: hypothetical protein KC731_15940 [Myxococcales bacterium]|nr:hypothetical protein [Myxococcales bacterium]